MSRSRRANDARFALVVHYCTRHRKHVITEKQQEGFSFLANKSAVHGYNPRLLSPLTPVRAMRGAPLLGPRIQRPTHPSALANLRSSIKMSSDLCPASAPFFGFMGAAVALIFASAYQCRPSNLHGRAARGVPVAPRAETGPARPRRPGWAPHLAPITPLPQLPICCRRRFPLSHVWLCPLDASTDLGAAYGTAKSGVGVSSMGVMKPDLVMKSIIPVVMAGVLGIYGLIIAVIIANGGTPARL